MKAIIKFIRDHWFTFVLLTVSLIIVRWVVSTQRPPGAMTPIEAQAMDMTAMKSPPGVQPVAIEIVDYRDMSAKETFPATIVAYNDENVIARIPGRVAEIKVYPGDKVRKGQLLARLEADEFASQQYETRLMAQANSAMATAFEREIERLKTAKSRAQTDAQAMHAGVKRAQLDLETMQAEYEMVQQEIHTKEAMVSEKQAELRYAEQNLERERNLYKAGAISLNELQIAETMRDSAKAKLESAQAEVNASKRSLNAAEKRVEASRSMLNEAKAREESAKKIIVETEREIAKAQEESIAKKQEAKASSQSAKTAAIISGYRELRALGDGIVTERLVSPGSLVMPGDMIMKLKVVHHIRIQAQLPERLGGAVTPGLPVTIVSGNIKKTATITSIFPSVDSNTRTLTVEALVENSNNELLSGMFAQMTIQLSHEEKALAVKNEAIRYDSQNKPYAFVLTERKEKVETDWTCTMHPEISRDGPGTCPICKMSLTPREQTGAFIAKRHYLILGATDGFYTSVLDGLKKGDKVIWAGHDDLFENAPVEPTEWDKNAPKKLPTGTGESIHQH